MCCSLLMVFAIHLPAANQQSDTSATLDAASHSSLSLDSTFLRSLTDAQKTILLDNSNSIIILDSHLNSHRGMLLKHLKLRIENDAWNTVQESLGNYYDRVRFHPFDAEQKKSKEYISLLEKQSRTFNDGKPVQLSWWAPGQHDIEYSGTCQVTGSVTSTTIAQFWICADGPDHKIVFFLFSDG